ncbi:tyrosine-type recombinase/integrase, partial [Alteromonas sp. 14N.309.X.WAT.G.H12]|uniref:tyrosine-type recombinase/integrase n=1 Tax=Alteromonas sp. 14N.309.X.WAT.G.H12 TaxID=3120824 RepID=UPI002FD0FAE9
YWYPKLALYSGMRLNEMSALPLSHIKQDNGGIWYFDLYGLDVKNEASERTVPIAQYLLDLGILQYINGLKDKGEIYLFPQIRKGVSEPGSAGWGDPISRWFNRTMLKNIGIDSEAELAKRSLISFHSSRRTVISTCVTNGEEHYLIKRIVGHSVDDDITLSVYADMEQIPLARLKEVLDKNLTWHKREVNMNQVVESTFKLFKSWDISDEQKSALLGVPISVSLGTVQAEPESFLGFSPDLKDRCILLLDINSKLKEVFSNSQNVAGYMTMSNRNAPFMGSMPIELASSSLEGLKMTHQAIVSLANSIG